jgi:hypothetical protein
VSRWLSAAGRRRGEVIGLDAVWRLARAWYGDPRSADWRPRTRDESQAAIRSAGLTGDFWELPR